MSENHVPSMITRKIFS
ncbi:unnamed protein product, partial [Vitis vinifera]